MSKFEVADGAPTGIIIHKRQADGSIKKFSADKKAATVKVSSPGKSAAKVAVARAQNKRTVSLATPGRGDIALSSHKPGTPYRYKHGWIPLEHGHGDVQGHGSYKPGENSSLDHAVKTAKAHNAISARIEKNPTGHIIVSKSDGRHEVHKETAWKKPDTPGMLAHHTPIGEKVAHVDTKGNVTLLRPAGKVKLGDPNDPKMIARSDAAHAEHAAANPRLAGKIPTGGMAKFGPTREQMIQNAEKMYGSDRSKWSVASLKSAVKMGDTRSSAELLKRANKRGVEKVTAKNASQISGKLKTAKPSSVDRRKK